MLKIAMPKMRWLCCMAGLLIAGCGQPQPAPTPAMRATRTMVQVEDGLGRKVEIPTSPQRIVTWGPGATEIVFALGCGARLKGRDSGSDYPPEALEVPIVADALQLQYERVVTARPDLIVAQGETLDRARMDMWQQRTKTPVVAFPAHTVEQVACDIARLGGWLGETEAGQHIARELAAAGEKPAGKKVFIEVQRSPLWTAGRGTLLDDVVRRAGFTNAAADVAGYKPYSMETLIAHQPDYYLLTMPGDGAAGTAELRRHPLLGRLACVRSRRILVIAPGLLMRPGPRLAEGIRLLARAAGQD